MGYLLKKGIIISLAPYEQIFMDKGIEIINPPLYIAENIYAMMHT